MREISKYPYQYLSQKIKSVDRRPTTSSIPIQNIYYLLSYAWEKGQYSSGQKLAGIPGNSVDGLLARMLKEALAKIPSHSSSYTFQPTHTLYSGVKGKVDLARSLKQGLLAKGKTWVNYEKLVSDTLYLQIARSAWDDLSLTQTDPLPHILAPIAPIPLDVSLFQQARSRYPHRSIRYLMEICEWIHCHYLPSPTAKGNTMEGIVLDPHLMPSLFEAFIRNFYKQHAENYSFVGRERLHWLAPEKEKPSLLPKMETDVSLISLLAKSLLNPSFTVRPSNLITKLKLLNSEVLICIRFLPTSPTQLRHPMDLSAKAYSFILLSTILSMNVLH